MRFFKFISLIFHPIVMPLIGLMIIFRSGVYSVDVPLEYKQFVYWTVVLCNILLPLSIIPGLMYFKYVQNITIDKRKERLIPLFFATICFYVGYHFVSKLAPVRLVNVFLFSSTVVILIILFISLFWKISIHMAGIGGVTGMIIALTFIYGIDTVFILSISIVIAGLIASSRLAMNSHSLGQIIAGYLVGILIVSGLMLKLIF